MGIKRTFNGCWTCRVRKVKCDTRQPTCLRCEKAQLKCQGYDVKLTFYQSLTIQDGYLVDLAAKKAKIDKYNRRNVALNKFPDSQMYDTYADLTKKIDELDQQVEAGVYNKKIGPFQVYGVPKQVKASGRPKPTANSGSNAKLTAAAESTAVPTLTHNDVLDRRPVPGTDKEPGSPHRQEKDGGSAPGEGVRAPEDDTHGPEEAVEGLIHKDLVSLAKLSIYGIKGPDYQINDQNLYHITFPTFFPNIDSDDWVPRENYLNKLVLTPANGKLLTTQYFELVQEFHTVELSFMKTSIHTHWDRYIKQWIENIMFENIIKKDALDYEKFNANLESLDRNLPLLINSLKSIINLLMLSICSFSKSKNKFKVQDNADIDEYLKISISFRKVGLNLLNYHLDEYDNNLELHDDTYNLLLLLAIVLEVEIDTYFNIYENYELLFSIGEIISQQEFQNSAQGHTLILRTLFRVMLVFYQSTQSINVYNYEISAKELDKYDDLREDYDLTRENNESINRIQQYARPTLVSSTYKILNSEDYNDYSGDVGFCPELEDISGVSENSVYLMYGLPKSLVDIFESIVQLANQKRMFFTEKKYPRNFPKVCSEMEDQLEKWHCQWQLRDDKGKYKSKLHHGIDLYIQAFHNSMKLYYKRLIKSEIHQGLIDHTYGILRQLHHLNVNIKLSYWMVLILETDNTNTKDNEIVYTMRQKLPNLTYWRTRQIIFEVTNRRLIDPINWMELIREWGISSYLG